VKENKKIVLFYVGDIDKRDLTKEMKMRLPRYMIPNSIMQLDILPLMPNGKMNRLKMEELYLSRKKARRGSDKK
jgi:acyl-CoA synthetase (AMP-forming)/AMP-acid ligase II